VSTHSRPNAVHSVWLESDTRRPPFSGTGGNFVATDPETGTTAILSAPMSVKLVRGTVQQIHIVEHFDGVTHHWTGAEALPWLRNPEGDFVKRWFLPAQIVRGVLHGLALYPLKTALLGMGRWGGLALASLLLLIGMVAGISGAIEDWVYSTIFHPGLFFRAPAGGRPPDARLRLSIARLGAPR
jgi:hypothetical protein